jgi:hypothetical protein
LIKKWFSTSHQHTINMKNLYNILVILLLGIFLSNCSQPEYYDVVERELASGKRYDSLFLGLNFGMTQKEFYAACWDMNKKGVLREGPGNMTAEYKVVNGLKFPARMNFFPTFRQDKIYEMPVTFHYESWAPWNKEMFADSLQLDVKHLYEKWYGGGFMEIKHPQKGVAFVKVDGNRRISIYKHSDDKVGVLYTDLTVEKK